MDILTVAEARSNLYKLIDEVNQNHTNPIIKGKRNSAVLIAEDDWRAIQETLFLVSIPGMRDSIREGMSTPWEETTEEIEW